MYSSINMDMFYKPELRLTFFQCRAWYRVGWGWLAISRPETRTGRTEMDSNVTFKTSKMHVGIDDKPNEDEIIEVEVKIDLLTAFIRALVFSFLHTLFTVYFFGICGYMMLTPKVGGVWAAIISSIWSLYLFYVYYRHHFVYCMMMQTKFKCTDMSGTDHTLGGMMRNIVGKL